MFHAILFTSLTSPFPLGTCRHIRPYYTFSVMFCLWQLPQMTHSSSIPDVSCFAMLLWPTYFSLSFRVSCYCGGKNPVVFHSKYITNQSSFFLLFYSIMSSSLTSLISCVSLCNPNFNTLKYVPYQAINKYFYPHQRTLRGFVGEKIIFTCTHFSPGKSNTRSFVMIRDFTRQC